MAKRLYQWLLDATAGAPLPFVLALVLLAFVLVNVARVCRTHYLHRLVLNHVFNSVMLMHSSGALHRLLYSSP